MLVASVPARYAAEIETVVRNAIASIHRDMALRDGDGPFSGGFIPEEMIDDSQAGDLVIVIAAPTEAVTEAVTPERAALVA